MEPRRYTVRAAVIQTLVAFLFLLPFIFLSGSAWRWVPAGCGALWTALFAVSYAAGAWLASSTMWAWRWVRR